MTRLAALLALLLSFGGHPVSETKSHPASSSAAAAQQAGSQRPQRIICLTPPVTEILFAIGAGPQVIAVGSFDRYPPEVATLQRVGALMDPDVERILSLRPDLVVVYGSQTDLRTQLERAHIPAYVYRHAGLADITATIRELGDRTGHPAEAARVAVGIEQRISAVRLKVAGRPKLSTLVVFEREAFSLRGIYASGGVGFVHDMIEAAGGANVFADVKREAVQATSEVILTRRPDVILEFRSAVREADRRREVETWSRLGTVPAVRNGRVQIFSDQKMSIAGPRVAEVVEILARTLHPESFAR